MHTLERFRECFYRPLLSSTENFDRWTRNGGQDAAERAAKIWRDTLEAYEAPPIDDAVSAQLQEFVTAAGGAGRLTAVGLIAERAYAALRDRIVTLRLRPGTALREDELMRELGIGRTPLREAVKRLALEDLVAVMPRSGTYVTAVEASDIVHISEVRAELEGQAAELAARRLDGELRDRAEHCSTASASWSTVRRQALMSLDEEIHRLSWEGSRNPYLIETLERYFALSLRVWYVVLDRVPA